MSNHWFPFFFNDYLGATRSLSQAEHGAYLLLLLEYASTKKPIPDNPDEYNRIAGAYASASRQVVKKVLKRFFFLTENGYENEKMNEILKKQANLSKTQQDKAFARWEKQKNDAGAYASAFSGHMPDGCLPEPELKPDKLKEKEKVNQKESLTGSPDGSPKKQEPTGKEKKESRGIRLPLDWKPGPELREFSAAHRPELVFEEVVAAFRDYWLAVPGAKGVKLDWDATFRTWVRNQRASPAPKNVLQGRMPIAPRPTVSYMGKL